MNAATYDRTKSQKLKKGSKDSNSAEIVFFFQSLFAWLGINNNYFNWTSWHFSDFKLSNY